MRLVAWNCANAASRKLPELVERLAPDVAVISECCDEVSLRRGLGNLLPPFTLPSFSMAWVGRYPSCGVAVLAFGSYQAEVDNAAADLVKGMKSVCPARITGPTSFSLLGIWADNSTARRPATEAALALQGWFSAQPVVVAGDFNNDVFWDRGGGDARDHTVTVELLETHGLVPVPNRLPTFHLSKNLQKPFVIDHAFVPTSWSIRSWEVGAIEDWMRLSGHLPLIVDLAVGGDD